MFFLVMGGHWRFNSEYFIFSIQQKLGHFYQFGGEHCRKKKKYYLPYYGGKVVKAETAGWVSTMLVLGGDHDFNSTNCFRFVPSKNVFFLVYNLIETNTLLLSTNFVLSIFWMMFLPIHLRYYLSVKCSTQHGEYLILSLLSHIK